MTTTNATPERLYLMQVGTVALPFDGELIPWSAGCYLIRMSDGRHVLVDSGMAPDFTLLPGMPAVEHKANVVEQLAGLGLQPHDIDLLICSHFDADHAGYHDAFTSAELIVQRRHDDVARNGHERLGIAREHWDHPGLRYRLVDGDTELLPGVTLLETSGHVPGHQSVLVRLPKTGPVLLAIDAVAMEFVFTPERPPMPMMDENHAEVVASTQKLLDLVEHERMALVVFHHDGAQWQALKKAPDYYD